MTGIEEGGGARVATAPLPHTTGGSILEGRTWDVLVVGAGPAGALAAHQLARQGKTVALVERQDFPRWKVCGACLSPGSQDVLRRAGLGGLPAALGARPLEVLRLQGWSLRAEVPLRGSVAISRGALDTALVEAAIAQGVVFVPRARARMETVTADAAHLRVELPNTLAEVTARAVVAADGLRSGILARAGAGDPALPGGKDGRVGLGAVFEGADPEYVSGVIHMAVGEEGYVGLVRTEDDRLNVAAALRPTALGRDRSPGGAVAAVLRQASFPPLDGDPVAGWKGTPNLAYHPVQLGGERVFAVGDAAGYVEPFTGEGMSWALGGAWTLAPIVGRAVERWSDDHLEEWYRSFRRTVGRAQTLCRGVAWTLGRPPVSRAALRLLRRFPKVAEPLVARAASSPPSFFGSNT